MQLLLKQHASNRLPARVITEGIAFGLFTAVVGLMVALIVMNLLPDNLKGEGVGKYFNGSRAFIFFLIVIWAPLFETIVGQLIPLEVFRLLKVRPALGVLFCTVFWSAAHARSNGLAHGLVTICSGAAFALLYLRFRKDGLAASYSATAIAHMTNNCLPVTLYFFFPQWI